MKLTLMAGMTIISILAMSVSTFNLANAQSQNQTSPQLFQDVQKRFTAVIEFSPLRELILHL